jgi:hypothetical protein
MKVGYSSSFYQGFFGTTPCQVLLQIRDAGAPIGYREKRRSLLHPSFAHLISFSISTTELRSGSHQESLENTFRLLSMAGWKVTHED